MPEVQETQNTFWMSRLKETTYGTPAIAGASYVRILTTDKSPWASPAATANDQGTAYGHDMPELVWNTTHETSKSFPLAFNFTDIGYWLQMALGSVSSSGSSPEYEHIFTPQNMNTSRQLPHRTFGQKLGGLNIKIFPSGVVNSLTIAGARGVENDGRLQVTAEVMGNGDFDKDPASYAEPSLSSGLEYGWNNQASVTINSVAHTCQLESWSWVFNNNVDAAGGYRNCAPLFTADTPESGSLKSELLAGVRDFRFNFSYRLTSSSDGAINLLKAGTYMTINNTITSHRDIPTGSNPYVLEIEHTRARVVEASEQVVNGYNSIVGSAQLLASSGTIPLTATLVNNTASYLV